jgi:hypothetical protein
MLAIWGVHLDSIFIVVIKKFKSGGGGSEWAEGGYSFEEIAEVISWT